MKKRVLVIMMACVLALALPCVAFAVDSAQVKGDTTTSTTKDSAGNDVSLKMTVKGADWVKATPTDTKAKNYNMEGKTVVAEQSFDLSASTENAKVTLVYTTDKDYAGLTCYVFVEHADGTTEVFTQPVAADGTVTVNMDKLSTVTFSISNEKYNAGGNDSGSSSSSTVPTTGTKDKKSTSPKTGIVA